ncbi:MAG TPA: hypothetical protein PLJ60_03235 [Chryseolinea sp.]|nr:hypothetical protein [Chryseolinea sp.]HPM29327.1 hypothetical protein [Chryseolinea sp.]
MAQNLVLLPSEMLKLVPGRVKGFQNTIEPKASQIHIGTLTYSLCEMNLFSGKRTVKILLFDFKEASIMYNQATRNWNTQPIIETDSLVERSLELANCKGWESASKKSKTTKLFLGISDRFFLTITGENVALDELRLILDTFPLSEFPK